MNICGVAVIILTFLPGVLSQSWSNVVDGTCKFTVNHNLDIRFAQNPLLFIDRLHANDLSSCRQLCCDHKTCNGYVWTGNDLTNEQCSLLKCSNEGTDCKNALTKSMVDKSQHEVGFITGIADSTNPLDVASSQPQGATAQTIKTTLTTVAVAGDDLSQPTQPTTTQLSSSSLVELPKTSSPRKGVDPTTTTTTTTTTATTISSTSIIVFPVADNLIKDEDSDSDVSTTSSTSTSTTHSPALAQHKTGHKTVSTVGKRLKMKPLLHSNSTRKGVIPLNSSNGHSDNVSLAGALSIGLIFVIVVFVLVGIRWWEGVRDSRHKTGYTRISYLLNGV